MKKSKPQVVTFKVNDKFIEAMERIPNRSEFIRSAILAALDSVCPLCGGTGIMTPDQKGHWEAFRKDHSVEECGDCHEFRLVCRRK